MPGLSIIIPSGDDVPRFEDTLAAVLRNRPRACEVIVPHAGKYADPYELASEVWFIELPPSASREACLAHAIDKAAGDVIHVLSPGCEFDDQWWQPAVAHFADPSIGCVAPLLVKGDDQPTDTLGVSYGFSGRKEVTATAKAVQRSLAMDNVMGPTHAAGFYRRAALKQIGGWPTMLPHTLADVDVGLSLRRLGYRAIVEPQSRISCPCFSRAGSAYQAARQRERLFWRHVGAASWPLAIVAHSLVAASECFAAGGPSSICAAVAGKLASLADVRECRAHAARLKRLQRLTATAPPPKSNGHHTGREDRPRRAA